MDKILTIIIPTYNMSEYLDTCLKSLIINSNLLEVLVINDGSKDNSLDIAKKYEKEYPHIFRTIDKQNGNYGSCVNRGLKEATGKYIKVLDADDKFNTKSLMNLVEIASKTDVDAFITDFSKSHIMVKKIMSLLICQATKHYSSQIFVVTKTSSIFGCTPLHTNVRIC